MNSSAIIIKLAKKRILYIILGIKIIPYSLLLRMAKKEDDKENLKKQNQIEEIDLNALEIGDLEELREVWITDEDIKKVSEVESEKITTTSSWEEIAFSLQKEKWLTKLPKKEVKIKEGSESESKAL